MKCCLIYVYVGTMGQLLESFDDTAFKKKSEETEGLYLYKVKDTRGLSVPVLEVHIFVSKHLQNHLSYLPNLTRNENLFGV